MTNKTGSPSAVTRLTGPAATPFVIARLRPGDPGMRPLDAPGRSPLTAFRKCSMFVLSRRFGGALVLLWSLWLLADYWPKPLPLTRVDPPAYIRFLKTVPPGSGILDAMTDAPAQMFYQTVHERPIAWGYVSRLPRSASDRLRRLARLYADGDYEALRRDFVIRYVVRGPAADTGALDSTYARVYSGPDAKVYDLAAGPDF